jgi:hypothetical protein
MNSQREVQIKVKKVLYHKTLHKLLQEFYNEEAYANREKKEKLPNNKGTEAMNKEKETEVKQDNYEEG